MFRKKKYVYHYSAIHFRGNSERNYLDGILRLDAPVTSYYDDQYKKLKELICTTGDQSFDVNRLTISSLSYLGRYK